MMKFKRYVALTWLFVYYVLFFFVVMPMTIELPYFEVIIKTHLLVMIPVIIFSPFIIAITWVFGGFER